MIGHDRTTRGAMRALMDLLAASGLTPEWIGARIDGLTHSKVPPALRRVPPSDRLSALDRALATAAEFERRADPPDIGYITEEPEPMPRKKISKVEFDGPATIDDLIEALTELRDEHGGGVTPRFTGVIEFNINGQRVAALSIVPEVAS
jgi:hypothetical protein